MKKAFYSCLAFTLLLSCTDSKAPEEKTEVSNKSIEETPAAVSPLPAYVDFRNWEPGDPAKTVQILNVYNGWDANTLQNLEGQFDDTMRFDLPDGRRITTTSGTIASTLGTMRRKYKETVNVPFSLVSLHNKDLNQDWVIAWVWNKWRYNDGVRDSMLYCDNWRFRNGKIAYMVSLENKPSKFLSNTLSREASK